MSQPKMTISLLVSVLSLAPFASAQEADHLQRYDRLANVEQFENRPTAEATQMLLDEMLFQRATQTYVWAMPVINVLGMKNG